MITRSYKAITARPIAILAVLLVALMLYAASDSAYAQSEISVNYYEKDTSPVVTLVASDPEMVDTVVWTLLTEVGTPPIMVDGDALTEDDVADHDDFSVSADGVLTFKGSPNYEGPKDGVRGPDDTAVTGVELADQENNVYNVVVQASDGGTSNDAAEAMEYLSWFKVTVTVMDVEEKGSVTLRIDAGTDDFVPLVQPQVSVEIDATLSDPDGPTPIPPANITWRWYRTSDLAVQGDVVLDDDETAEHDLATYTPRDKAGANDVDMYLRVKATYEDARGKRKTAEAVTPYPVLAAIVNLNTDPEFAAETAERRIAEDAASGTAVGRPVTANDPDEEKLSYSLVAATGDNTDDLDSFSIDPETGQIKLAGSLDFEMKQEYMFQVRATDSRAGSTGEADNPPNVTVTVKVTDVDEMPGIAPVDDEMLITHAGGDAIEHIETAEVSVATYTITDDDEGTPVLSVSGADAAMFDFDYGDTAGMAVLAFSAKPDFEAPADENMDNIYEVTVEADDGNNVGTRNVTVKVTNAEEAGEVTLSHQQPLIGQELTATVTDSDGGFDPDGALTDVTWMWERTMADCPDPITVDTEWEAIGDAEDTYKPIADDDGRCLRATAEYLDRTYEYPHAPVVTGDPGNGFDATAQVVSGVVREDPANSQPEFPGTAARFVPENTPEDKYVGDPVRADDADSSDVLTYSLDGADEDSFEITRVDPDPLEDPMGGQIRVGVRTDLDHETDPSYDVVVEATDSTSQDPDAFASTDVDIYVTDVDEKPDIWVNENGTKVRPNEGVFNVDYDENGSDPVLRLMASDPEGVRSIVWSLLTDDGGVQNLDLADPADDDDVAAMDVADHAKFSISADGVLSFTGDDFEGDSEGNDDVYHVVVQASDGGTTDDDAAVAPGRDGSGYLGWFKVTVTVMDKEEDGTIALTPGDDNTGITALNTDIVLLQPQVDVEITASLTDPDGGVTGTVWKWERKGRGSSRWETIAGATEASYTPQDKADTESTLPQENRIDVGDLLRVTATYTDTRASGGDKTAVKEIENPVLGAITEVGNSAPEFATATATRRVDENASGGTPVGAPVTAVDPDLERQGGSNRKVTYWLGGNGANNALFSIDAETGQIKVGTPQDFENPVGGTQDNSTVYEVVAMATDSSAVSSAPITVTINLIDRDEAPKIALVTTAISDLDSTDLPTVISHAGGNAIEFAENGDSRVVTFTVSDDDGGTPTLSLSGTDSAMFKIENRDVPSGNDARVAGALSFKESPDFEAPADRNGNNIYEVTIVADDGRNTAELDVTVKVTNAEEDGEVTLSYQQPLIGRELTASVTDPDGGFDPANGAPRTDVTAVTWQWHVTSDKDLFDDDDCPDAGDTGDAWADAVLGRAATYTPTGTDNGGCLRATAMYLDRTYDYPQAPSDTPPAGDGFDEMVQVVSGVVRIDPANKAPVVDDAVRFIPEKTPGHRYVGDPVTATDGDPLVYSLGGDDQTSFYIAEEDTTDDSNTINRNEAATAGQIWVGPRTDLDYEGKETYSVEVTATDTYNEEDTGEVTITVVDVDEAPTIVVGALAISGPPTKDYAENGTGAVDTYTAVGPHADSAGWSLEGADAGAFTFDTTSGASVMLSFRSPPDYENPADADEDNTYMVTLKADDGTYMDDQAVMVMVTNMEELGTLSGPEGVIDYAENGTEALGTYSTDGPVGAILTLEGDDAGDFSISGGMLSFLSSVPDYENPTDADTDNTYMVTVKAEAGGEMDMATVTINVTDMNEAPMFAAGMDTRSVAENTAAGENVGDPVMAMDEDEGDTLTHALGGDDADSFMIDGETGQISVGEGTELDFESEMTTYTVTVTATDGEGLYDMITVTINVTNVNDHMPMFAEDTAMREVAENAAAGTDVGMVTATDADDDSLMYSDDSMYFDVDPETGQIMVAEGAMLDYEMEDMHTVTVTASDGESSDSIMVTIMVTDMNEAPMFAADMDTRSVAENTAAGENVGDPVMAMDEDESDTLTYALGGDDAASFAIDAATGQIMVGEGTELDFESEMTTYTVTVTATDDDGLYDMVTVTINVTNVNEQPMFADDVAEFSVAENAAAGTDVGMVMASDGDDILMFSDDSMYFDVDSETGQIVVAEGAMLDYEMEDMHTVTVTASDGEDTGSIIVTITVTDMYPACGMQGGDAANMYLNNDCEALLDSKDALGGSLNWDEDMPINDWDGIQGHAMFPSLSGDPMRVTALHLQKGDLDGMIPDALGRLSALTYLNAHSNTLSGMVPGALGMLTNLEVLYLNNNELDGTIGDLSGATSLEVLWLKSNQLTGGIPASLGSLSNLMNLRLFNNPDLGGSIPMELGSLSNLTHLVVQDTGLSGEIPMELGNLSNLMWLGLYNNELSGTIPMELGSLSNLEVLYLHYNQLTGEIPDELGNLAALTNLWLKSNQLSGEIPSELGDLTNLERVRFSRNPSLTGCVPAGLAAVADNDFIHLGLPTCQ